MNITEVETPQDSVQLNCMLYTHSLKFDPCITAPPICVTRSTDMSSVTSLTDDITHNTT